MYNKHLFNYVLFTSVVLSLCFGLSCTNEAEPENTGNTEPDPPVFEWREFEIPFEPATSKWHPYYYQADSLNDVWGNAPDNIYAVGSNGTILHYNGTEWKKMVSNTVAYLTGIWGSSSDNIFAVGDNGTILHYNGTYWKPMESGTTDELLSIWGSSSRDVFIAIALSGTVLHFDGVNWKPVKTPLDSLYWGMLWDFWGTSSNNIYAVGSYTAIFHWNGNEWSVLSKGDDWLSILKAVWGSSPNNIYAAGFSGEFWHYDGDEWSKKENARYEIRDIWGTSPDNIYAVGHLGSILHYDGDDWSYLNSGTMDTLYGIWGSSDDNIFIVGEKGVILHYTGE
jgi:photosystem II stability/assembly factor-like uncharacterized protein